MSGSTSRNTSLRPRRPSTSPGPPPARRARLTDDQSQESVISQTNNGESGTGSRPSRKRQAYLTLQHIQGLTEEFEREQNPTGMTRRAIASRLGLPLYQVTNWFSTARSIVVQSVQGPATSEQRTTQNDASNPPQPIATVDLRIQHRNLQENQSQVSNLNISEQPGRSVPLSEQTTPVVQIGNTTGARRHGIYFPGQFEQTYRDLELTEAALRRGEQNRSRPHSPLGIPAGNNRIVDFRTQTPFYDVPVTPTRASSGIVRDNTPFAFDNSNSVREPRTPDSSQRRIVRQNVVNENVNQTSQDSNIVNPQHAPAEPKKTSLSITKQMAFPPDILKSFGPEGLKNDDDEDITDIEEMVFQKLLRKKLICDICMIHMKQFRCCTCFYSICQDCLKMLRKDCSKPIPCPQCRTAPAKYIPIILPTL